MSDSNFRPVLAGQKALVIGVANEDSIAYGCAKAFRMAGADLAITWLNEKARPYVEPLAEGLEASISGAVDVSVPANWRRCSIRSARNGVGWTFSSTRSPCAEGGSPGRAAQLFRGRLREGHGHLLPLLRQHGETAAPLMMDGGTMFAMTYYGANASCRTTT